MEGDLLLSRHNMEALTDWRLVARPSLMLQNLLPVTASYILWERTSARGPLVMRQKSVVTGGSTVLVYAADMRQQVIIPSMVEWPIMIVIVHNLHYHSSTFTQGKI